jgi:hypothetical protein
VSATVATATVDDSILVADDDSGAAEDGTLRTTINAKTQTPSKMLVATAENRLEGRNIEPSEEKFTQSSPMGELSDRPAN